MFDFKTHLSDVAQTQAAPFAGYPPHHFVGGNIDEATVPVDALADTIAKILRDQGRSMAKYGMESGPQGYLPLREAISEIPQKTGWDGGTC